MQRYRYVLVGVLILFLLLVGVGVTNVVLIQKVNPIDYVANLGKKLQGKSEGGFITSIVDEHADYDLVLNSDYPQAEVIETLEFSPDQRVTIVISDVPQQITIMDSSNTSLLTHSFSVKSDSLYTTNEATITLHVDKSAMNQLGKTIPETEVYFKKAFFFALAEWQNRKESIADDYQLDNPNERMSQSFDEGSRAFRYLSALEDKPLFFIKEVK